MVSLYFVAGRDVCPGVSTAAKSSRLSQVACEEMSQCWIDFKGEAEEV